MIGAASMLLEVEQKNEQVHFFSFIFHYDGPHLE